MDRDSALQEAKGHLEELLQQKGITNTRRPFRCLNPDHEDRNPSMSYDPKRQKVKCFSCGADYDVIDILGLDRGYTNEDGIDSRRFNETFLEACDRFNIPLDSPTSTGVYKPRQQQKAKPAPEATQAKQDKAEKAHRLIQEARKHLEDPEAVAYLQKRGISLETAQAHGLGYLPSFYTSDGGTWQALIIPTSETSVVARNIHADTHSKKKTEKRGEVHPFNLSAIYEAETVHLCEGEIDALSVCEVGGAAIGLGSASYTAKFIDALKQAILSPSKPLKMKTLILSLDNDESGLRAAQNVRDGINALKEDRQLDVRLKTIDLAKGLKDPNEALVVNREAFAEAVKQRATDAEIEAYKDSSAQARLFAFYEGVNDKAATDPIPTGFKLLDAELDGGLREGLVVIPAITSLGKTTLALQMIENIAKHGEDVLYITLEMSGEELIAKSLSRHTFLISVAEGQPRANAKTVRGITDGKRYAAYSDAERALIMQAYEAYNAYASHIYIYEGLGDITATDIRKMVQRHRDITGKTPVVCLDYVQILKPLDPRASDKQNMDAAVLELKRISRDYKTPVIILSSLNRMNYDEPINLAAMKESGALEYSADIVLGLQLQGAGSSRARNSKEWINDRMKEDPRHLEMKVLKNRNGRRGESLYFDYYSLFNLFDEQQNPARPDYDIED